MSPHVDESAAVTQHDRVYLPDFHSRLTRASDRRGLSPAEAWRGLTRRGIRRSRPYVYKLFAGLAPPPSYDVVGGLADILQVDVRWFYVDDRDEPEVLFEELRLDPRERSGRG